MSLVSSCRVAIGMKRNEACKVPDIEAFEATTCAVQNMFLTVKAYGLGSYRTTAGITYSEGAKPYFEL